MHVHNIINYDVLIVNRDYQKNIFTKIYKKMLKLPGLLITLK